MFHPQKLLPAVVLAFILPLASSAQPDNGSSLRDSLRAAAEELAYHPDSIDLRLKKAGWNMELKQWTYAKAEYDYVLDRDPHNPAALFYRAYTNEQLGRYNFARLDYQNLLVAIPGNFEAQLGLALLNEKDKHLTEAMDGINLLVAQHPDSAVAWAARGGMEKGRGMLEPAAYDYGEAVRRDPANADYLVNLADVQLSLRRKDEARLTLRRLEQLGVPRGSLKKFYQRLNR